MAQGVSVRGGGPADGGQSVAHRGDPAFLAALGGLQAGFHHAAAAARADSLAAPDSAEFFEGLRAAFQAAAEAAEDVRALHLSKGHDYADADDPLRNYVQSAHDSGMEPWRAAFARLAEKYHRLSNLIRKDVPPAHEGLDDTLLDIAAIALIVRSLRAR